MSGLRHAQPSHPRRHSVRSHPEPPAILTPCHLLPVTGHASGHHAPKNGVVLCPPLFSHSWSWSYVNPYPNEGNF
ncbi:Rho guanine nucleotide exchange factor [Sesbania bispinosa]|nr:Rho guanine nucleotide exchange factor [Sesbania bispinosa]